MISEFSKQLQTLNKEFGFTEEQLIILERYTDECLERARAWVISILEDLNPKNVFNRFELLCMCDPDNLRKDYIHPDIYWSLEVWYKPFNDDDAQDVYSFRNIDHLNVFLDYIRSEQDIVQLDCGTIIFIQAIAKIRFQVTQRKRDNLGSQFFVRVEESAI